MASKSAAHLGIAGDAEGGIGVRLGGGAAATGSMPGTGDIALGYDRRVGAFCAALLQGVCPGCRLRAPIASLIH